MRTPIGLVVAVVAAVGRANYGRTVAFISALQIADLPSAWAELGFTVSDGRSQIGTVVHQLDPSSGRGVVGWTLAGVESDDLDGLRHRWAKSSSRPHRPTPTGRCRS